MTNDEFMKLCKQSVVDYFNGRKDSTDKNDPITEDNVFLVWMCKTLQNHKALVSTTVSDGMYYELTYCLEGKSPAELEISFVQHII